MATRSEDVLVQACKIAALRIRRYELKTGRTMTGDGTMSIISQVMVERAVKRIAEDNGYPVFFIPNLCGFAKQLLRNMVRDEGRILKRANEVTLLRYKALGMPEQMLARVQAAVERIRFSEALPPIYSNERNRLLKAENGVKEGAQPPP